MNYWLHRISYCPNISYPLLKNGYISIGFSDFAYVEFLKSVAILDTKKAWENFENNIYEVWGNNPRFRYSLWRFVNEMKKGDWVIVPSWGTFSVYEILDDNALTINDSSVIFPKNDWGGLKIERTSSGYIKTEDQENNDYYDLGFLRRVKAIEVDIPRSGYADSALTARMKIRQTNACISDLKVNIEESVQAFRAKKLIDLKSIFTEKTSNLWCEIIQEKLNPDKFEKLIKWYLEKIGASQVIIPPKNELDKEGDRDVQATFENLKTNIYVQVKFHTGEEYSEVAINQIKDFAMSQRADKLKKSKDILELNSEGYSKQYWVVTSADVISQDCIDYAKENDIVLINGKEFASMLINAGLDNLENFENIGRNY